MTVQSLVLIISKQVSDSISCLVEIIGRDAESNAVLPNSPVASVELEGLFGASQCLSVSLLHGIAI